MLDRSAIGKKSQKKGKTGQELFAQWCRSHGFDYESCRRKDGDGLPRLHVEVKFYKSREGLDIDKSFEQSIIDAERWSKETGKREIPILAWRVNYQRGWNIVMRTVDLIELYTGEPCRRELFSKVQMEGEEWMGVYKKRMEAKGEKTIRS